MITYFFLKLQLIFPIIKDILWKYLLNLIVKTSTFVVWTINSLDVLTEIIYLIK